jgi:predicted nucleic acid-binding protein
MIFVDSNIPMYLIGVAHPLKLQARRLLEHCIAESERLVTSAEVFQEILHRYTAMGRREAIQPAFDAMRRWSMKPSPSKPLTRSARGPFCLPMKDCPPAMPCM